MKAGLVCLFCLWSARAQAQTHAELERAKEFFQAGAAAYAAGEYLAAIQAFDAAYELTPVPAIVFSLAQAARRQYVVAHEREHLDRAIQLFRQYLQQMPSGGRRPDALEALSQLEPMAALQAAAPRPPEVEVKRPTRVMISSDAPAARVSLDGGPAVASPLIREVAPGKHRVSVAAPGFFAAERELTAVAGELIPVAVPLREQVSTVAISAPRDAELYVDGTFAGRGGAARVTLPLASGPHHLAAAQNGHRVFTQDLTLERGSSRTVEVKLEPTPQRRVARALVIGGVAALGATVVFGALALEAEHRAQTFLTLRSRGNVSGDRLDSYQSALTQRGRYRAAAAIGLTASAGCLLTALFLYQYDRPSTDSLYRSPQPTAQSQQGARHLAWRPQGAWHLDPLVTPTLLGASVAAAF